MVGTPPWGLAWVREENLYLRFEDTVVVTDSGVENFTAFIPMEARAPPAWRRIRTSHPEASHLAPRTRSAEHEVAGVLFPVRDGLHAPEQTRRCERNRHAVHLLVAVNADGRFGAWRFAMARSVEQVREVLDAAAS